MKAVSRAETKLGQRADCWVEQWVVSMGMTMVDTKDERRAGLRVVLKGKTTAGTTDAKMVGSKAA